MVWTMLALPPHALRRLIDVIAEMDAEDAKPFRQRDVRVYIRGNAVVETYGALLDVSDPGDPKAVCAAAKAAEERHDMIDGGIVLTRLQLRNWAGRHLDDGDIERLGECIPNSSVPDAVAGIVASFG